MRSDAPPWRVQLQRFTVFPQPSEPVSAGGWYQEITGYAPESVKSHPRLQEVEEEGLYGDARLTFSSRIGRIDFLRSPASEDELDFGEHDSLVSTFHELITRVAALNAFPSAFRIAYGTVLVQYVQNRQEGYERLANKYLKDSVNLDPVSSRDFSYQINRPCRLGDSDVQINRIAKWSVSRLERTTFVAPNLQGGIRAILAEAIRLELDINTAAEFSGGFPKDKIASILGILAGYGKKIAEDGDVGD